MVRRTVQELARHAKLGVAATGVVLMCGLAGWGGSMIALSNADAGSAASSNGTAEARPPARPATSAPTSTSAATTQPTAPIPPAPPPGAVSASTPTPRPGEFPQTSSMPPPAVSPSPAGPGGNVPSPVPPPPRRYGWDIVFVGPSTDSSAGQWYYRIGLLGFPAGTVVEISGYDTYGNAQVAPLVMTTADGSSNPFTAGVSTHFAYGGTCDDARPTTVTARGQGFSVTERAPRPLECDGGTTPNGPWTPPTYPTPEPTSPPTQEPWGD